MPKLPERANMPKISSAAHKTLSTRPNYNKQHINQTQKTPIIETCPSCNKQYNKQAKDQIIQKITPIKDFNYNQCLDCIKTFSNQNKQSMQQSITLLKDRADELEKLYLSTYSEWKLKATEYQDLDYQEKIITHNQKIQIQPKKSPNSKTDKTLAMKILEKLSPEQQEAILTLLKNQVQ